PIQGPPRQPTCATKRLFSKGLEANRAGDLNGPAQRLPRGEERGASPRRPRAGLAATRGRPEFPGPPAPLAKAPGVSVMSDNAQDVTGILQAIEQGDPQAAEQLLPLVYDELRQLAAAKLAQEKPGQTLQPTALVHEAYL